MLKSKALTSSRVIEASVYQASHLDEEMCSAIPTYSNIDACPLPNLAISFEGAIEQHIVRHAHALCHWKGSPSPTIKVLVNLLKA